MQGKSFSLNNIKVRKKLLMIYMFCIVLPLLITNSIFASKIINNVKKENIRQYESITETIKLNIKKEFESVFYLSNLIYTDWNLYSALEKDYTETVEEYEVYKYFQDYVSRIHPMFRQVDKLLIYTTNNTIPLTGNYIHNDMDFKDLEWYRKLDQSRKTALFYTYIEDDEKYLSIIRPLNYLEDTTYEHIIKIDLNYDNFISYMKNNSGQWDIYLVNSKNEIILSSNDTYNYTDKFAENNILSNDKDSLVITKELDDYSILNGWSITGVFEQESLQSGLNQAGYFIIFMMLLSLCIATSIIFLISKSFSKRLTLISDHIRKHNLEILSCNEGTDEIGEIIREYNLMTEKMKDMIKNEYKNNIKTKNIELERRQAIINALQSQINPHFLFNTLETVRMRCNIKQEYETGDIIKNLSKLFRSMLLWSSDMIQVRAEINLIEDYLKIQRYRFGDKINYEIIVHPEAEDLEIPKMTLQPLVENACVHGIESISGSGKLTIKVTLENKHLICIVQDNGKGMEEAKLEYMLSSLEDNYASDVFIGIKNVYKRLKLLYDDKFSFRMESSPTSGTKVTISIAIPDREHAEITTELQEDDINV